MLPRQKILLVAIAVPAVAMAAYFATKGDDMPVPAPVAATPIITPTATTTATLPMVAEKPAAEAGKNAAGFAAFKAMVHKRQDHANALTQDKYDAMRQKRPHLPDTLSEYKQLINVRANTLLALSEDDFNKHMAKNPDFGKGSWVKKAARAKAAVAAPVAVVATPTAVAK